MSFLPPNSTKFEIAAEEAMSEREFIAPALEAIAGIKYARPIPAGFGPWLVNEYGLSPITGYFDTVEHQIDYGRAWQRIRGTPDAVKMALGWTGYDNVTILDQVTGRRLWTLYQANMGELPLSDEDRRLYDAEYLAGLSDPARALFWRGFYGYDVRGHVWGRSRLGRSLWGTSSGVRINDGKTIWSHGRTTSIQVPATPEFRDALGFTYTTGEDITWDGEATWDTEGLTWNGIESAAETISGLIESLDVYLGLFDEDGDPIAYVRCLTAPSKTRSGSVVTLHYDIRTGFGDGAGSAVRSVSLIFGGRAAPGVKPFQRYLLPNQITFPDEEIRLGDIDVTIDMKKTIREFFAVGLLIED